MAKSFYEGLFGFDKDMKLIPVLAEGYDGMVATRSFTLSVQQLPPATEHFQYVYYRPRYRLPVYSL